MEKKKPGVAGSISVVWAVLNGIGLLVTIGGSLVLRQKFMASYQDLGVELPTLTRAILSTHGAVWILVLLLLLAILAVKEFIPLKWIPLVLNAVYTLLGLVYWVLFSMAMMIPMVQTIEHMQ